MSFWMHNYCSQNKAFIRGANPGVSDTFWDKKNAIGGRSLDITIQELKDFDIRKRNWNRHDWRKGECEVDRSSRSTAVGKAEGNINVSLRCVFEFKLSGIHLTDRILKDWVINSYYAIDVSIFKVKLRS